MKCSFTSAAFVAAALLLPANARGQQNLPATGARGAQAIRGRVTTDSGAAIAGADVIVTIAPSAETIAGKSDAAGAYRVDIPAANATGEYLVYIGALGRRPFRRRVTMRAADTVAVVDATLAAAVTTLAAVTARAQHPRPRATLDNASVQAFGGALDHIFDGVADALPPDLQGSIDAMASMIPGLATTGSGFSAFGLGPDANLTTLNGMSFGAGSVPRDLQTTTSFLTSPWDPAIGGFSGALAQVSVAKGNNVATRIAHLTFDSPMLQVGDPIATQFGQKYTSVRLGAAGSGAFALDKYFYNYGITASRQMADVSSLLDFDADALEHSGISPDSAHRLTQILAAQHVPLTRAGIPSTRTTTNAQFMERFDYALPNPPQGQTPAPAWDMIVGANYRDAGALSLSPTTLPANTASTTSGSIQAQGQYTRYFGKLGDYVSQTALGASFSSNRNQPYLTLPTGDVLLASALPDEDPTVSSLSFGGNSVFASDSRNVYVELHNQTDWLVHDSQKFPTKLYVQGQYQHFDQSLSNLGAFSYNSLASLASNTPSVFTRTLNVPERAGGEFLGAAALGGSWSTTHLTLSGGARVDANAFTGRPQLNPLRESTFGVRNDAAPKSIALSPRLGFSWYPSAGGGPPLEILKNNFVTSFRTGMQIRGGVGEFRSYLPPTLLAGAIGATGLPGSSEQLICTGPAAPIPDWQSYANDPATIPTTCAGGTTVFADTAAQVSMIDPSFAPSRSWRATLGWTNSLLGNYVAIDGAYSLNLDQASIVDLNFAGVPKFALPSEGDRPVFVSAGSVVPGTGSATAVESRLSPLFGRVADRVSDLRSDARQITVYAIPNIPFRFGFLSIAYNYVDARGEERGFEGGTARDPRAVDWASQASTPRHQFIVQGLRSFFGGKVGFTASARVQSGLRYTPIVNGDINGDGWSGDRAFIFDPSRVADTALAHGLRDLMASGSHSARACLTRQLNAIAGRSSCVGPWTTTMDAGLLMPNVPGTNNRVQASVHFSNPLGGLDQLLHGSSHLHGWGEVPFIDGTLYQVRGFDAAAQRYEYVVNSRFGTTDPALTTLRAPFRVTLDVRIDYGRSREEQQVELNLRIKPPLVGTRATADTIEARYLRTGFTDPYRIMLRLADSLALSRSQVEQTQAEEKILLARADTVYHALAVYLAALPRDFDPSDAVKHVNESNDAAWKLIYAEAPFIKSLLTAAQIRRLPAPLFNMVTIPNFKGRFFGFL